MKTFTLFVSVLLFCMNTYASQPVIGNSEGKVRSYTSDTLVYFGLDFSNFYLLNSSKIGQGQDLKNVYAPVWIRKFEEEYYEKRLEKLFGVAVFHYNTEPFQTDRWYLAKPAVLVRDSSDLLDSNRIQKIVKEYETGEKTGLGVSLIVEELNKKKEFVSVVFTFFDLETKNVLYAVRDFGVASGTGMEVHWRAGLKDTMYEFMLSEYNYERRKILKKQKKADR